MKSARPRVVSRVIDCPASQSALRSAGGTTSLKRILTLLCSEISLRSNAMIASATLANARPSPGWFGRSVVRKNRPMIMSWVGMVTGRPSDGFRMLFVDSIRIRASA